MLLMLAACQTQTTIPASAPTIQPFPTMTPGRKIVGALPTVVALQLDGSNLANPATAVALANQPTPTPDYAVCPPTASPILADTPTTSREMAAEITRFLSLGGLPAALDASLRDDWRVQGDSGAVRADVDLTGEGQPDVVTTYLVPGEGGALLVAGCANGRYATLYETSTTSIPQLIYLGDMNVDRQADILFTSETCTADEDCNLRTQFISWEPLQGRFNSLLGTPIVSQNPPEIADVDNDRILEIVVRMTSSGTPATGPLRTGVTIYDWNGTVYMRSITQLDPPRFRIQVLHQADRHLAQNNPDAAVDLYELSLADTSLGNWFNDDPEILRAYALFRLLTTYAFTEDNGLLTIFQSVQQNYPDPQTSPVYVGLSNTFWNALQLTGNLRSACLEVQEMIRARPEALSLLSRYGQSGPVYTAEQLCPF